MILVCGEALVDLFVDEPAPGRLAELPARAVAGGSPFNVAVGLARLGAPAGYFGGISTDALGGFLMGRLQEEGIDTALVKRVAAPTPLAVAATGADGQPVYAFYAAGSAYSDILTADLPDRLPDTVAALAMGSFALSVEPVGSTLLALAEREARRVAISLDPNLRPALAGNLAAWRARFGLFAAVASIVKLSVEDLHTAWGPEADADAQAAAWLAGGVELVVVTDGAEGATGYCAAGKAHVSGRRVEVIDTVGAGDTFHAALLSRLAEMGRLHRGGVAGLTLAELRELLRHAVLASSITCTRRGADLPTRADLAAASGAAG